MGYLKEKYLEGYNKETEVTLQKYEKEKKAEPKLTEEEQKLLDEIVDCQIEDMKFKGDEERGKLG